MVFNINISQAKHAYPEKFYQENWCKENNGILEQQLVDGTRVDCLTKDYAVEFDFAPKWAEAIGQSLYYSGMTGKKAAINLIIEKKSDFKYYDRIKPLCESFGITLWYSEKPKKVSKNDGFEIDLDYLFDLIINFIKSLFKILS